MLASTPRHSYHRHHPHANSLPFRLTEGVVVSPCTLAMRRRPLVRTLACGRHHLAGVEVLVPPSLAHLLQLLQLLRRRHMVMATAAMQAEPMATTARLAV